MKTILRKAVKKLMLRMKAFRRPSVRYVANHGLLPDVVVRTSPTVLRKLLLLPESQYTTQLNQEVFALIANKFKRGFFVEIGANDGFNLSNTIYLEEKFEWGGLLIEANPQYAESLSKRKSSSVIAAVVEQEGYYEFCSAGLYGGLTMLLDKTHEKLMEDSQLTTVWGTTLQKILEQNNAPTVIHFISIDVEGAEVPIVEQMCRLQNYRFVCGCIEHNNRRDDYERIENLLMEAGYKIVWEGQTQQDLFFIDERGLV